MITSVNLSALPFMASCDSTRAQMASKQMAQSLTHANCDIPYIISEDYRHLVYTSNLGILIAEKDGKVLFNNSDILIYAYNDDKKLKYTSIPLYKNTAEIFGSKLRFSLKENQKFKKGQVIFEYDNFKNGIPSFGYNTLTAYCNFFSFNHEDSLVVSEDFANRAISTYYQKIFLPIYEHTIMQPIFNDNPDSLVYFPNIGQKLNKDNVLCSQLKTPQDSELTTREMKNKVLVMFNNFTISDLINIQKNQNLSQFSIDQIKPKVKNGILTGIKVHKINKNSTLVDSNLQNLLNKLFDSYCENHVIENYNDLMTNFGDNFAKEIMKKHIMYTTDMKATNKKDLKNISYLLEFEITSEDTSHLGDKFANRFAGKGVISLILPNELRPIAMATNKPIDCLYNSFGVFSRMNISQVLEGIIGKSVMNCEYNILSSNGSNIEKEISLLNENIIKYFNMNNYYNSIKELYSNHSNELYNDILKNGLFIEAPSFKKINIKEIIKNSNNIMEPMLIKKECLEYMEDLLKINLGFKLEDVILPNVFIGPIYMLKLHKISKVSMNVRDLGAHKFITKQPTKGKSIGGGLRFGDMEFRSIISHGCIKTIKELMTVKSDYVDGKEDLILQLVEKGEYNIGEIEKDISGTKKVVNTLIKFLND